MGDTNDIEAESTFAIWIHSCQVPTAKTISVITLDRRREM